MITGVTHQLRRVNTLDLKITEKVRKINKKRNSQYALYENFCIDPRINP